jgi:segregation and condensation protein A
MTKASFTVSVEKFDGPMDVLLELIEKEKLDITQISMAKITDDFLAYMRRNSEIMEPSFLASFLVVASRLVLIKSRVLLPFLKFTEEEEVEMVDLEQRLIEYKKFKEAGKVLRSMVAKKNFSFSREQFLGEAPIFFPPKNIKAVDLAGIVEGLIKEFESLKIIIPEEHVRVSVSLQNIIANLKERIFQVREIAFSDFKKDKGKKIEVILTFLAILEMIKGQVIVARQEFLFGEITLSNHEKEESIIEEIIQNEQTNQS